MRIKKIIYQFYYNSNILVDLIFWGYFLVMIIYHVFISEDISLLLSYIFFVLLGMFLGYKLARKAYDYLKANQESK